MHIVCMDLESVLIPEIWVAVAELPRAGRDVTAPDDGAHDQPVPGARRLARSRRSR